MKYLAVLLALVAAGYYWREPLIDHTRPWSTELLQKAGLDGWIPPAAGAATASADAGADADASMSGAGKAGRAKKAGGDAATAADGSGSAGRSGGSGGRRGGGGPTLVATATATAEDMPVKRRTIGYVASPASLNVTSQTQGIVTEVVATEGAAVKTGDVIARLDTRIAEATVAKDQATLDRDKASLEHAQNVLARQQKLAKTDAVSQQSVEDAQTNVETAAATVALDEAVLKADQITLSQMTIKAPFDGRLGAIAVVEGSLVQPGGTIVRLTRLDPLDATFTLPETDVGAVHDALQAGRPVTVAVSPLGSDATFTGTLDFIDPNLDSQSGSFTAKATLVDAGGRLLPGQSVSVIVTLGTRPVVAIPSVAVQAAQVGSVVYVVGSDGRIAVKPVTVAITDGDRAGIAAGLEVGDRVVTEGQIRLTAGQSVVDASNPPPSGDAGGGKPAGTGYKVSETTP